MFVSWNNFLANVFQAKVSIARCSVTVEVLLDMVALRVQLNTDSPYNIAYPYTTPGADSGFSDGGSVTSQGLGSATLPDLN